MPFPKGHRLGAYEIVGLVGRGGMGEVYRAHDSRLHRDVAIKTCLQPFDERFEKEARAIAALNHPNVCQVYDVGPDYLVMELVDGPTLQERIEQGAIPLNEALRIAEQVAEALAAAHQKLITHRDLKPGNIKIKEDGTVKVLDFGLAKVGRTPGFEAGEDSPTISAALTQPGAILGTAAYMSPEQARGKPVDSRSDIWAFGVVLYEMLTARRLFQGEGFAEILASVVRETPDLAAIPRSVRPLLEACLQKDPAHRLQAIGDRRLLLAEPERQRLRWLWPTIAAAFAVAAVALAWAHFREVLPPLTNLRYHLTRTDDSGFIQFQLSPDGRYLAFVSRSGTVSRLCVRAMDSLEDRQFPGTDGTTYPFWSPDGAHIGFFSQGKLKQVALAGGPPIDIADAPDACGGTWGRDCSIVFAPAVTGTLLRVAASGGPAIRLELPRAGSGKSDSLRFPQFLPDSDRFFYTIEAQRPEGFGIYVGSVNGDPPIRVLPDFSLARFVRSPGLNARGYIFFCRQNTLMAQPFDPSSLKTTGEALPLADGVAHASGNSGFEEFTVSSNGVLAYATSGNPDEEREIVWLDRAGKRGKSILKQKGITDFALSPDQTRVLYSLAGEYVPGDLWLLNIEGGASQRFTFGPFSAYSPVWSPDGATAVFTAFPEDRLYVKKVASSAKEEALRVSGTDTYASSWSDHGKVLAFSQHGITTNDDLWLLPMEGESKPVIFKQTPYTERSPQISPDGRWIVYSSDASGRMEIYIEPIAPGVAPQQISSGGGANPQWRADGRELYFLSSRKLMAVDVTPGPRLTFKTPRQLFDEPHLDSSPMIASNTVSRQITYQAKADGSEFLMLLSVGAAATAVPPPIVVTNWKAALKK